MPDRRDLPLPLALALFSGLLYTLLFPPFSCDILAWIFLVPLLLSLDEAAGRRRVFLAFASFLAGQLGTTWWISHVLGSYTAMPAALAWFLLFLMASVVTLFYLAFALTIYKLKEKGVPLFLSAPVAWVAFEALREPLTRFPWNYLGYCLHPDEILLQGADLFGVHGLSFLVVAVNGAIHGVLRLMIDRRRGHPAGPSEGRRVNLSLGVSAALLLAALLYGHLRLRQVKELYRSGKEEKIPVALIQGNVDQAVKWNPELQDDTLEKYLRLTEEAAGRGARLVVWPEAATPFFVRYDKPRVRRILNVLEETGVLLLFGSPDYEKPRYFNSAIFFNPTPFDYQKYDKMLLVPFGEYVPFPSLLFFIDRIAQGAEGNGAPGARQVVFDTPVGRLAPLICYEGVFPGFVRRFVRGEAGRPGAEILVNITNDAWFGRSGAPYQHLVMEAFRSVENRIYMVRAANTGVSAAVTPWGEIVGATPLYEEAAPIVKVKKKRGGSLYGTVGEILPRICWLATALLLLWARLGRRGDGRPAKKRRDESE